MFRLISMVIKRESVDFIGGLTRGTQMRPMKLDEWEDVGLTKFCVLTRTV